MYTYYNVLRWFYFHPNEFYQHFKLGWHVEMIIALKALTKVNQSVYNNSSINNSNYIYKIFW